MAGTKQFTIFTKFAVKNGFSGPVLAMSRTADKAAMHIDKVRAGALKMGKNLGSGLAAGGKFLGGIALAAGAAGAAVFSLAKATEESADNIQNTANALGITTKALQEYRYVGIQAGLTTEDMDAALRKLTVNLGKDSGDVENALYQIGLTAEQLKAAGPDQTLEMIANGFKDIQDPQKKAAVATALFGKSSIRMVNALDSGSEGIKGLRKEAEDIGYVMGGDTLKNAGDFNDQLDKLSATAVGLRDRLSAKAIPGLQKFTAFLQKGIQPGGRFDKILNSIGGTLGKAGTFIGPLFDKLMSHLPKFLDFIGNLIDAVKPLFEPLMSFIEQILTTAEKLMPLITTIVKTVATVLGPILDTMTGILKMVDDVLSSGVKVPAGFGGGTGGPEGQRKTAARLGMGLDKNGMPMSPATSVLSSSTTNTSRVQIDVGNLPPGSSVKQDRPAPGVTLNTGKMVKK